MRNNWTHISLGDACDIINGKNQKAVEDPSGAFPIYGSGGIMGYANSYLCKGGSTIIGRKGTINRPLYVDKDFWNVDTAFGLSPKAGIAPRFLFYLCKSINWLKYNKSTTLPSLVKSDLLQIPISVPGLAGQQRIVDELDLLSDIIDKKKAQLRDLDALTQSIFYEMFGDPIANEKGWRFCALKDVSDIVGGSTPKTNVEEYWGGTYNWVTPAELHGERYQGSTERKISDLAVEKTNLTLLPVGTVLLSSRAPIGKVAITTEPMYCNQGFKNLICSESLNNEYVCQALKCKTEYLQSLGTGATFKEISKKTTENIKIAVPPIALQTEFAKKVVAIEAQKRVVCESLIDSQSLFDSKMSYYFE